MSVPRLPDVSRERVADVSRQAWSVRRDRLAASIKPILLAALAASLAWFIARYVLGHRAPFFAPIAALVVIGLTVGQRARRAVELAVGQAIGILVADALIGVIGTGVVQIALVIVLAMVTAVLVGSGPLLTQQAATSAALVATIQLPGSGLSSSRFVDALVGGGVALVLNLLIFPTNPLALVRREAGPLLHELAATLEEIAQALAAGDEDAAEAALQRARGLDALAEHLRDAVVAGRDTLRYAPMRRSAVDRVDLHATAAVRLDLAVRNVRVLARRALRAAERGDAMPESVVEAIQELARAALELDRQLAEPDLGRPVREPALRAARLATAALAEHPSLSVTVLIAQVRSTALDLLQAAGVDVGEALKAIEAEGAAARSSP